MRFYKILQAKQCGNAEGLTAYERQFVEYLKKIDIKTITGVLPLTFTAKGGTAADWVVEGNNNVGKNLLEIMKSSSTVSGVSFVTNKNDGTIIANGTAQGNSTFQWNCELAAGSYVLSGCLSQGSNSTFGLNVSLLDWSQTWWDYGSGAVINLSETTTTRVRIVIYDGTTVNNLVFKPMIRKSDTSPDFEPYQQGVGERTENIFTNVGSQNGYLTVTGGIVTPHANLRYTDFLTIPTGATTITFDANFSNSPMNTPAICFYDASKNFISGETYAQSTPNPRTFTVPNGAFYCRTSYRTAYSNVMLVEGSTAPQTYIPYGYQIPLTVSQQGQTDKTYDIYIGDSPLTEGQRVSKTSTGQDIELFGGENTISTTLYNKPEMEIKYK